MVLEERLKLSRIGVIFLIGAGILLPSSVVTAGDTEPTQKNRFLGDRWNVRLFGNLTEFTSDVSAGQELGALVNLEELLGFDDQITTWSFDAFYRFSKNRKHTIRIGVVDFSRDAYTAVSGSIPIFDVEFLGEVASDFGNQVGTLTYQYSFTNTKKTEAGILAGVGFYKYSLSLEGRYILNGDVTLEEFGSRSENVLAPVPTVGFFVNYALRPNLILDLRTTFINLSIGAHQGRVFNTFGNITWYFLRNFGIGLGLSSSDVVYENTGGDNRIKVDLRQTSLTLNASLVF
jgi:hypothetical protein